MSVVLRPFSDIELLFLCFECDLVLYLLCGSANDPDPVDPQDFGFLDLDPDPKKYADPRSKMSAKNFKITFLLSQLKFELLIKEIIKFSDFLMVHQVLA